MRNTGIYQCFSKNQKLYLESKGFKSLVSARHKDTNIKVYMFVYSPEFIEALKEYSKESERRRQEREYVKNQF